MERITQEAYHRQRMMKYLADHGNVTTETAKRYKDKQEDYNEMAEALGWNCSKLGGQSIIDESIAKSAGDLKTSRD